MMSFRPVPGLRWLALFVMIAAAICIGLPASAQMGGMGGMGGGMGGMGGGMGGMGGGMGGMGGGMGGMGGGMGGMGGGMGGMGGGMGGMGGGMGGMGGGMGGGGGGFGSGVVIDAQGVLRTQLVADPFLAQERFEAARESLPGDLRRPAALRKVALSRLEAELTRAIETGAGVPDDIQKLAGLTRVQYVFVYPAADGTAGEIVIAGPAEPWMDDAYGRTRGLETGRPTLLLEHLAAAIRSFAPGHPQDRLVGCSIDPTQEGLAAMQQFLRQTGRVNPQATVDEIVNGMKDALGTQKVSVQGVASTTHFAHVMVEADYRMKLIGIGLEPPPVRMRTWIEVASAGAVAANALQRWYFVPDYRCLRVAEDDLAIELVGQGVQLKGADEVVMADGRRLSATRSDGASKAFTEAFTRKYPEIAARHPVYAQLRNLVDLVVVAAWLQEHDAYGQAAWSAATLRDEGSYTIERLPPAAGAETAIHAVWKGNRLLTPIGGGVTMHPRLALDSPNLQFDEQGDVAAARTTAAELPAGRWWWD
jgi:hypothetical protein